jgi:hypothetical protein
MKRCVGPRHGIVVTSVILAMFFGTSCVVAEDTPVAEFRVFVDGAILSQVDSNVVFSSQAGSLLARVTAANPANKPKDVLRALLLTSSQVTGIELTLELDNALSNQLGRNTEPVRKWEGTGLPNSTYFRNGDRYEFAGVTFTADQIPILLDHTGDSRVFHISMDEVNSTAYWRAISLPTFAQGILHGQRHRRHVWNGACSRGPLRIGKPVSYTDHHDKASVQIFADKFLGSSDEA